MGRVLDVGLVVERREFEVRRAERSRPQRGISEVVAMEVRFGCSVWTAGLVVVEGSFAFLSTGSSPTKVCVDALLSASAAFVSWSCCFTAESLSPSASSSSS